MRSRSSTLPRSMNRTNAPWPSSRKVGTPNTPYWSTRLGVLGLERLERAPAPRLFGHGVGVEAGRRDRFLQHVFVGELLPVLVARREEREVRVEELVGERVAHRDAVEQRAHPGAPLVGIAFPHRRLALADVHLVERERHEAEVDVVARRGSR